MKKMIHRYRETLILISLTLFALGIRLWRLKTPSGMVFDEVYYVKFANDYIAHTNFLDVHPPLGKIVIAAGIKIFGDWSFAWRFFSALFGAAIVPLSYLIAKKIFSNPRVAYITALLILFDGLFFVQSRTALLTTTLLFFNLCAILAFFNYRDNKKIIYLILTGIFFGFAISTQWLVAPFILFLIIYNYYFIIKKHTLKEFIKWVMCLVIVPLVIYVLIFLFDKLIVSGNFYKYIIDWHVQSLSFHSTTTASHPYQSRWQTWMFLYRPAWYYYQSANNKITGIIALGNPLIWWPALFTFFYCIWNLVKNKKKELLIPIIMFLAYYLFWIPIKRTQFQYYILQALPFYFMLTAYFWTKVYEKYKIIALIWLILIVASFIFFYPILSAWPISTDYYNMHLWLKTWI